MICEGSGPRVRLAMQEYLDGPATKEIWGSIFEDRCICVESTAGRRIRHTNFGRGGKSKLARAVPEECQSNVVVRQQQGKFRVPGANGEWSSKAYWAGRLLTRVESSARPPRPRHEH